MGIIPGKFIEKDIGVARQKYFPKPFFDKIGEQRHADEFLFFLVNPVHKISVPGPHC